MQAAMPAAAAGIGIGSTVISNVLGSLFGKKSKSVTPDYTHLKQGIQWKVADAKKAGIHPLYALGAQVGSPGILGQTETGSTASDALSAVGKSIRPDSTLVQAQIRSMNASAQADEALAAARISDTRRRASQVNSNPTLAGIVSPSISQGFMTPQGPQPGPPARETIRTPGGDIYTGGNTPAEVIGDEFSDVAENVYGLWNLVDTLLDAAVRNTTQKPKYTTGQRKNRPYYLAKKRSFHAGSSRSRFPSHHPGNY